jgi:hypothetical protein
MESISQSQVEDNRESQMNELEALSMTLSERELEIVSGTLGEQLVLSRRPSKNEWKEKGVS